MDDYTPYMDSTTIFCYLLYPPPLKKTIIISPYWYADSRYWSYLPANGHDTDSKNICITYKVDLVVFIYFFGLPMPSPFRWLNIWHWVRFTAAFGPTFGRNLFSVHLLWPSVWFGLDIIRYATTTQFTTKIGSEWTIVTFCFVLFWLSTGNLYIFDTEEKGRTCTNKVSFKTKHK